ncbi:Guanine deaminase [Takifugu flavidus]|uniref:Guanine deaminase n=1 Tax=Takifugu flavidus TaxID=433684 RepID=A0A5C6MX84_9TELE|nr:Guanine deaminase [Takifugu flavidus]
MKEAAGGNWCDRLIPAEVLQKKARTHPFFSLALDSPGRWSRAPAGPVQSSPRQERQITPMATSSRAGGLERVFRGTFIHSTPDAALQILEDALLGVDSVGKIAFVGKGTELDALTQDFGFSPAEILHLGPHEFFMPGLVDTHIHAPQYSYAGTGLDMPLLEWLKTYTFPAESCFHDLDLARRVYTQVVVSWLDC